MTRFSSSVTWLHRSLTSLSVWYLNACSGRNSDLHGFAAQRKGLRETTLTPFKAHFSEKCIPSNYHHLLLHWAQLKTPYKDSTNNQNMSVAATRPDLRFWSLRLYVRRVWDLFLFSGRVLRGSHVDIWPRGGGSVCFLGHTRQVL